MGAAGGDRRMCLPCRWSRWCRYVRLSRGVVAPRDDVTFGGHCQRMEVAGRYRRLPGIVQTPGKDLSLRGHRQRMLVPGGDTGVRLPRAHAATPASRRNRTPLGGQTAMNGGCSGRYLRTQPGTLARIWFASVVSASPMSKPCASKSITTFALDTMARSLLKPGRPPCSEF